MAQTDDIKPKIIYKTVIPVTILSEIPIPSEMEIDQILQEMTDGSYVGQTGEPVQTKLQGKEAAKALYDLGSEPEFFEMDDEGNNLPS